MRVLITGICGFVGSTLAQAWVEAGRHTVFGIDNLSRAGSHVNRKALRESGIEVFHGDIRCPADLEALPKVDYVVDAAANPSVLAGVDGRISSRQIAENNLVGTLNTLEFCKKHGAGIVLLSSSRVYSIEALRKLDLEPIDNALAPRADCRFPKGASCAGIAEDFSTAAPVSLYGATKLASELLALEYGEAFEIPVWINRCGILAGARQFGHAGQGVVSYWIHAWARTQPLRYLGANGKGHQTRDVLDPVDLLPLLDQQMDTSDKACDRIFNVGGGVDNAISLNSLSAWCRERFGPHDVAADTSDRPYDIPWMVLDSARARQAWNWKPQKGLHMILEEIADFAERNPQWIEHCGD